MLFRSQACAADGDAGQSRQKGGQGVGEHGHDLRPVQQKDQAADNGTHQAGRARVAQGTAEKYRKGGADQGADQTLHWPGVAFPGARSVKFLPHRRIVVLLPTDASGQAVERIQPGHVDAIAQHAPRLALPVSVRRFEHLMKLFVKMLEADVSIFLDNNIKLRVIGSRDGLSDALIKVIGNAEEKTRSLTGGELLLCLNYGGHLEIADAVKKVIRSGISAEDVTPELIAQNLYAPEVPPCDLIVRTSGEQRLSNFMLWRAAYSELMFIDKHWPDMTTDDVTVILDEYARRNRRFGG